LSTLDAPRDRTPGGSTPLAADDGTPWEATQASEEFQSLKRALRRFVFPATVAFLAWYLLYVLMAGYARGVMDTKVLGNINVAYVFGLLQFLSTFAIAYVYARYAEKHLDPTSTAIRERLEGDHR
jgi:uncharacterized membrane protein (DUF485 family)